MTEMTCRAVKVLVDGSATIVDLGDDTLKGLYQAIECRYVDVVRFPGSLDMWIDDEGAVLADARVNLATTTLARTAGMNWQAYCGTGVFTNHDDEGTTVSLTENEAAALVAMFGAIAEHIDILSTTS